MQNIVIVLLRVIILYFLTLIIIRYMGRTSLWKTTAFKFISYIVIAIMISLISLGLTPNMAFGLVALAIWVLFTIALDYLAIKSKWVHDAINGRETVLIKEGKVMEENLKEARYTGEELLRELRSKNVFNLSDVEFALMEDTGEVNVLLKPEKTPVTPKDLNKKVAPRSEPQTVILDGTVLDDSLTSIGLNRQWLNAQLSNAGVSIDNVFIGQVDSSGDLYIDLFDDLIEVPKAQVKELLYATMSKVHADLLSFSLETKDSKAKKMYSDNANKIKKVIDKLEPYLLR